jgi:hypothetical protein
MFLLEVTFSQMAIHSDLYLGSNYQNQLEQQQQMIQTLLSRIEALENQ